METDRELEGAAEDIEEAGREITKVVPIAVSTAFLFLIKRKCFVCAISGSRNSTRKCSLQAILRPDQWYSCCARHRRSGSVFIHEV